MSNIVNKCAEFKWSGFILAALIALTYSCATKLGVQDYPATASAKDEVQNFQNDVDATTADQVDVLSPANYKEVRKNLKEAKKSLDENGDEKDTLHSVAVGRAHLEQARKFAEISKEKIGDVVIARKSAIEAGAAASLEKELTKVDENLTDVTSDIEKNKFSSSIEQRSALQLEYLNLELKAIKQARLSPAQEIVKMAEKEGAKEFAPRSLAIAVKTIKDVDAYITANRKNTYEIIARSNSATQAAEHSLKITRDAKSGQKTSNEDTALQIESEQKKAFAAQNQVADATSLMAQKDSQLAQNASDQEALASKNASLQSDQTFNERFEVARKSFSPSEAEVYKQGNKLVIRLRGLEFPVSKAELRGSSFALLAKVQKVIDDFGKGTVIVEGHTDSNGNKQYNDKLSASRADAVRDYLLSINSAQLMEIESIGYGFQKPLATNKTSTGRSQNRRVDIVIEPEKM